MIKNITNRLLEIGADKSHGQVAVDRIRILNGFASVCVFFGFIAGIIIFLMGEAMVALMIAITISMMGSILILNYKGFTTGAKIMYVFTSNILTFLLSIFIGYDSGFQLYYLICPLVILIIFGIDQIKTVLLCTSSYLVSFLLIELLHYLAIDPVISISADKAALFFSMNSITAILLMLILVYGFITMYRGVMVELKDKNTNLGKLIKEKDVLITEVHHRVNNNLSVVSGLFKLQSHKAKNGEISNALNMASGRINMIGFVQKLMYLENKFSEIGIKDLIEKYIDNIEREHSNERLKVKIHLDIDDVKVSLDQATPFSLIFYEVLSNAFQHAFEGKNEGEVSISVKKDTNNTKMTIKDNGVGFSETDTPMGLGLDLINILTEDLNAEHSFKNNGGTCFEMVFS